MNEKIGYEYVRDLCTLLNDNDDEVAPEKLVPQISERTIQYLRDCMCLPDDKDIVEILKFVSQALLLLDDSLSIDERMDAYTAYLGLRLVTLSAYQNRVKSFREALFSLHLLRYLYGAEEDED